jgi:hypothetical protein
MNIHAEKQRKHWHHDHAATEAGERAQESREERSRGD